MKSSSVALKHLSLKLSGMKKAQTRPITTVNNSQRVLKSFCFIIILFIYFYTNYSEQRLELFNNLIEKNYLKVFRSLVKLQNPSIGSGFLLKRGFTVIYLWTFFPLRGRYISC